MDGSPTRHQEKDMQEIAVQVIITHPNIGHATESANDIVARLTVKDAASNKQIMEIELTAADFHRMLASRMTTDTCVARVLEPRNYEHVGKTQHHFSRHFPTRTVQSLEAVEAWAQSVQGGLGLHSASVWEQNNGKRANWDLFGDYTPEHLADVQAAIDNWAPPAGDA
jgi:hypothetical protein